MIYKYELISPVTNRKKPFLDRKGFFIVPNINKNYKYYVECSRYNPATFNREYFLLLGTTKFDEQCRTCRVDDYCRLKVYVHGELKDFITKEMKDNGNINFEYLESEGNYDVYILN